MNIIYNKSIRAKRWDKGTAKMLEFVAFACGFAVMVLEFAGARMLAPYIGTSFVVWTTLIGVIMASLSFGYWIGGKLADKKPNSTKLSIIIFLAGIAILYTAFTQNSFLQSLVNTKITNIYILSVLVTIRLFAIPSILLGMVSPYIIKVAIVERKIAHDVCGSIIGRFYALSTLGSILGTFICGFFLIVYFGMNVIFFVLAALVMLNAFIVIMPEFKNYKKNDLETDSKQIFFLRNLKKPLFAFIQITTFALCVFFAKYYMIHPIYNFANCLKCVDSQYQNINVLQKTIPGYGTIRYIKNKHDNNVPSLVFLNNKNSLSYYLQTFMTSKSFNPNPESILMIGGGGATLPRCYLLEYDKNKTNNSKHNLHIDMVEIDPVMTQIAKQYFFLKNDSRLSIYNEDARIFINQMSQNNKGKYDTIYFDAFNSEAEIPFQLVTVEAFEKMDSLLSEKGVLAINVVDSVTGDKSKLFRVIYSATKKVFPYTKVFLVNTNRPTDRIQNIVIIASKTPQLKNGYPASIKPLLKNEYTKKIPMDLSPLTDNYAPIERYLNKPEIPIKSYL